MAKLDLLDGYLFKRALTDDERNAFGQYLSDQHSLGVEYPEPSSPVDIKALLKEARPLVPGKKWGIETHAVS